MTMMMVTTMMMSGYTMATGASNRSCNARDISHMTALMKSQGVGNRLQQVPCWIG